MTQADFMAWAKQTVRQYAISHGTPLYDDDVFIVWYCKTLQNHKALLGTTLHDMKYYEFTYNGDKEEAYLDVYTKWENVKYDRP